MKTAKRIALAPLILTVAAAAVVPGFAQDTTPESQEDTPRAESRMAEMDADGDGQVSLAEIDAYRTERFGLADTDGDGQLSAEELTARMAARNSERAQRRIERMIEARDANGDGVLSFDEMSGGRSVAALFAELDSDGDGVLAIEEFAQLPAPREFGERRGKHRHGHHRHHGGDRGDVAPDDTAVQ